MRTITYNVRGLRGWPDRDDAIAARFRGQLVARIALELALYEPDVVTLQEAPPRGVVAAIAARLGMRHAWLAGGYPGAVLTRYGIVACDVRSAPLPRDDGAPFSRHWGIVRLRTGGGDVVVHSLHLHPRDAALRIAEICAVCATLAPEARVLVQGDANHEPDGGEYAAWRAAGLIDAFAATGEEPGATKPSDAPTRRIDYLWCGGGLQPIKCRVLQEGAFGRLDPLALSDHLPVLCDLE